MSRVAANSAPVMPPPVDEAVRSTSPDSERTVIVDVDVADRIWMTIKIGMVS